jgi:hypothetical protein
MPKPILRLQIVHRRDPQLQRVNEKIAALAAMKPWDQVYATLASSARLAAEAMQAAKELQQLPGASLRAIQPTREFWQRVRDYNRAAALVVSGETESLAEALATFHFLQNLFGKLPDAS